MQTSPTGAAPSDHDPGSGLVHIASLIGGQVLATAFGVAARCRGARALHPVGLCGVRSLTVEPVGRSGVALLDELGPHPCQIRWSRATGMRRGPDIEGLAVRVQGPGEHDCTRRHSPVGHPPVGTWTHPLWTHLREPSYAASQAVRAEPEEPARD